MFRVDTDVLNSMCRMLRSMEDDLDYSARKIQSAMYELSSDESHTMEQAKRELQRLNRQCQQLSDKIDRLETALRKVIDRVENTEDRLIAMVRTSDLD